MPILSGRVRLRWLLVAAVAFAAVSQRSHAGVLGPILRRPTATPSAGPVAPRPPGETLQDLQLVSVTCRVDDGPVQMGPEFVADLADHPRRATFTALIANMGPDPVAATAGLAPVTYPLVVTARDSAAVLEPGRSRSFTFECQLVEEQLRAVKTPALPLYVAVIASSDYVDDFPANNSREYSLVIGRPDLTVVDCDIVPHLRGGTGRGAYILSSVCPQAFLTVQNLGTGRLPAGSGHLRWSAAWYALRQRDREHLQGTFYRYQEGPLALRHHGDDADRANLPPLRPGETWTVWLGDSEVNQNRRFYAGRVYLEITIECVADANQLNNTRAFDREYFVPLGRSLVPDDDWISAPLFRDEGMMLPSGEY